MKRFCACLCLLLSLMLCACGAEGQQKQESAAAETSEDIEVIYLDYGDEQVFEKKLNEGENLEGKTVRFTAREVHPDSALGYNVWAGSHLNFVSARNPDIAVGDKVTVRAETINKQLGSWIIYYEKVDRAEDGEQTLFISDFYGSHYNESGYDPKAQTDPPETTTTEARTTTTEKVTTTEQTTTQAQTTTTEAQTTLDPQQAVANGDYSLVTPAFKKEMDAYEAFYDDYIAFMRKYTSGTGDMLSMMNDYLQMMQKLNEWSAWIDTIDETELSPADDAYYLLVTLRVSNKLLKAAL